MFRRPRLQRRHQSLRVGYVLSYYFPQYVRTKTLIDGLRTLAGVEVYEAINRHTGLGRYVETLLRLLWLRLRYDPDCYILGFRGYEFFWPVRLLTRGRFLIVDHLMSPYDSLLNETGKLRAGTTLARLVFVYERGLLRAADAILTDTQLHRDFFSHLFHVSKEKIHAIPVGADERLFRRNLEVTEISDDTFTVLFYGSFLPLHGIDVILDAAEALKRLPVRFTMIGGNRRDLSGFHQAVSEHRLTNIAHLPWVEYRVLPQWIAGADLGLGGPFGGTGQARRVVTGKTYQFLAMAKPTVVGEIGEDCGFVNRVNCLLVPQADPRALLDAIGWAFEHRDQLPAIGAAGYQLYNERFSAGPIGNALASVFSAS